MIKKGNIFFALVLVELMRKFIDVFDTGMGMA